MLFYLGFRAKSLYNNITVTKAKRQLEQKIISQIHAMAWYHKVLGITKKQDNKEVPEGVAFSDTEPRGAISKAYYPGFLVKPPFGWPKFKDIYTIRRVASAPQPAMAIQTIIDEVVSVPRDIIPKEGFSEDDSVVQAHIDEVKTFFENPNSNKESFGYILRIVVRELLEIDSGIIVKEFNKAGKMVEIRATDGAGFLKNPNEFGKYEERDDIILDSFVNIDLRNPTSEQTARPGGLSVFNAQMRAAYFQYGYLTSARPVPFGKREIVWMERNPISFDIYGRSPIENLIDVIQTLIHSIQYNLDYFEDNNVPKGFIQLAGASKADLQDFSEKWNELQLKKDPNSGRLKKIFHRVPITSSPNADFKKVQFSAQELELISSQQWFTKLVWGMFGVTPSELGFTEDSNRATEIAQSRVFRRKAILPLLNMLEYHINKEIISEFGYEDVEFKFNTFDIEEETAKYNLYKLQIDTRIKSINEIRRKEGLPDVEWGDEPQGMNNMEGFNPVQKFDSKKTSQKEEMEDDAEQKALTTRSPVALGERELLGVIRQFIKRKEKEILKLVKQETNRDRLSKIKLKSIDDIVKRVNEIFSMHELEIAVKKAVETLFTKGWVASEKTLNQNLFINKNQIKFLQDYTFDNIKGVEEDFKNKLKQELRRAIIQSEGIGKVAERVRKVFDITEERTETIARTELNRAENQGQLQAFKKSGKKMTKTWLSAHDARTSDLCKRLDGQTVDIDAKFKDAYTGGEWDAPPSHVNCRSTLLFNAE